MRPAREAHWDAEIIRSAQDGGHALVEGVVLTVAVEHVGAAAGGGGGFAGDGERGGGVCVDPEGPQSIVEVEDEEGGEREGVSECGRD